MTASLYLNGTAMSFELERLATACILAHQAMRPRFRVALYFRCHGNSALNATWCLFAVFYKRQGWEFVSGENGLVSVFLLFGVLLPNKMTQILWKNCPVQNSALSVHLLRRYKHCNEKLVFQCFNLQNKIKKQ